MDVTRSSRPVSTIGLAIDVLALAILSALAWYLVLGRGEAGRGRYLIYANVHTWSCAVGLLYLVAAAARGYSMRGRINLPGGLGLLYAATDALLAIALGLWLFGAVYGTTSDINHENIEFYKKITNLIFVITFIILFRMSLKLLYLP